MSFLTGLWAECLAEPRSRFAALTGTPGMGKSRVRFETCARIRAAHPTAQVWLAESDHRRAGSPLSAFRTMLTGALGLNISENDAGRHERIASRVARHVTRASAARVTAFLAEAAAIRGSGEESVELRAARSNPSLMGDQIERAWLDFVSAECRAHPTLIVMDDAQWADEASLRLIAAAVRSEPEQPLMVMAFGRPELTPMLQALALGEALVSEELHQLSASACERLVRTVLPSLEASAARRIAEIANGNPFFLEELIRAVAEGKQPSDVETVVAIMQSRLEELPASARRVLRAASTFGEAFRVGGLRHLLGEAVSDESIEQDIQTLCDKELLGRTDSERGELAFRHAIVRDASYSMLTDEDRKLAHRLAGEWLEEQGEHDGWLLANHYVAAEEGDRAAEWFARAAEQASEINDHRRASECAELGVQYAWSEQLRARLLVLQAEAARWQGAHDRAAEHAREAVSLLDPSSDLWPRAIEEAVRGLSRLGNTDEAGVLSRKLVDFGRAAERSIPVNVLFCRVALAVVALGESSAARELIELAEAAARQAPRRDALLDAHLAHARAVVALHGRLHFDQYASALQQTIAAFGVIGDMRGVSAQSVNLGYILTCMGALRAAVQTLELAIETAEPRGLHHIVAAARHNLGHALALTGAHEQGLALEQQSVEAFAQQADRRLEGASRAYCARILTMMGRLSQAEDEARHALSMLDPFPSTRAGATAALAHVLARLGKFEEVLSLLESAIATPGTSTVEDDGTSSVARATALLGIGRRQEARGVVASACTLIAARGATIADRAMREGYLLYSPRAAELSRLAMRMGILYPSADDLI